MGSLGSGTSDPWQVCIVGLSFPDRSQPPPCPFIPSFFSRFYHQTFLTFLSWCLCLSSQVRTALELIPYTLSFCAFCLCSTKFLTVLEISLSSVLFFQSWLKLFKRGKVTGVRVRQKDGKDYDSVRTRLPGYLDVKLFDICLIQY